MARETHSFIDIAAHEAVRGHFAAGDAVVILSTDLSQVLWANGAGAALFGFGGIEAAIGADSGLSRAARRQIEATPGFPDIGSDRQISVRLAAGMISQTTVFLGTHLKLPDDDAAIMLVAPLQNSQARAPEEIAARIISGFEEAGNYLALLDDSGQTIAATPGFETLGLETRILREAVEEAGADGKHVVKKIVRAGGKAMPIGLACLSREPARHLLIAVDESVPGEDAVEPDAEAPPSDAAPVLATPETAEDSEPAEMPASPVAVTAEEPAPEEAAQPEAEDAREPEAPAAFAPAVAPRRDAAPVRFVWRTDAAGRFSAISPEFLDAVGASEADIVGQRFADVAHHLGIDVSGDIAALLDRRDTWSGRSVLWPVDGGRVPVDLAALPAYGRDRQFEGFRGFGIVRLADLIPGDGAERSAQVKPLHPPAPADAASDAPVEEAAVPADEAAPDDPFKGEPPVLAVTPAPASEPDEKIIRLAEHRAAAPEKALTPLERSAFREIGEQLKRTSGEAGDETQAPAAGDAAQVPDEADEIVAETAAEPVEDAEPTAAETEPVDVPAAAEAETAAPEAEDAAAASAEAEPAPAGERSRSLLDFAKDGAAEEETAGEDAGATSEPAHAGQDQQQPAARIEAPPLKQTGFLPSAFAERGELRADTSILSQLPIPVLIHSGDTLHYANDAFFELTGYGTVEELAENGGLDALLSGPAADRREGDNRVLLTTRAGEAIPVSAFLQSVPWLGGKALLLTLTRQPAAQAAPDTSREAELRERVEELRTILDTATDGVVLISKDGKVRSISRPAEALFGYDSGTVVGKPFVSLFALESQRAAADYLAGLAENGVASVLNDGREVIGREAQGRFIPLFMTIGRLPGDSGFCAVLRDITHWKRAEEDLTQARAQAERTSSQKSDFLARVSHEIRTPLNAIIGFSELMLDEKFGPVANDRYRDYLRDINRSGNHVLDLVNDLLDISKIEAGQQEMEYEAVALNDALAETVAMMQPQANRERVIIRSSFASKLPEVVADLRSVRQIALNILSNAVRYTQAGGQVIVSTAYEPSGEVVMRVRDTGIGMTQTEIEQALKPFKQINALKRPRGDGTGLGLPLTKAMVEANRAKFSIYSTPGEGTLVEVTFPATRVLAE